MGTYLPVTLFRMHIFEAENSELASVRVCKEEERLREVFRGKVMLEHLVPINGLAVHDTASN